MVVSIVLKNGSPIDKQLRRRNGDEIFGKYSTIN